MLLMDEARPAVVGWQRGQPALAALVSWAVGGWLVPLALAATVAGDPGATLSVVAWAVLAAAALCVPLLHAVPAHGHPGPPWEEHGDQGA
jgi:hypothetical protein